MRGRRHAWLFSHDSHDLTMLPQTPRNLKHPLLSFLERVENNAVISQLCFIEIFKRIAQHLCTSVIHAWQLLFFFRHNPHRCLFCLLLSHPRSHLQTNQTYPFLFLFFFKYRTIAHRFCFCSLKAVTITFGRHLVQDPAAVSSAAKQRRRQQRR